MNNIMVNLSTLVFAIALFVRCNAHYPTSVFPSDRTEEDRADPGSLDTVLGEDLVNGANTAALSSMRSFLVDQKLADEDRRKRIFVTLDVGARRDVGGARPDFGLSFPALSLRRQDHTPSRTLRDDHYNTNDLIPIARRDQDPLRCMIGRVYRPCW
ncbi:pro-MCH [Brachyhypopomus gauderio]|uniref:pro-MCH n=1 Tax=Brachyhypopomus gauderio TaxID=698409 RepID=UPI0040433A56